MKSEFVAVMILGESDWQIDVRLGAYPDEATAEQVAKQDAGVATLAMIDDIPSIKVSIAGSDRVYRDEDVVITEISPAKKAVQGRPLDPSVPEDHALILEALETQDPAYTITGDDMVPSTLTLADFVHKYGVGYRPDHLAWGVK